MRIKSFETNGFGCLKGSYHFGSLPSTLIIEKNEQGKSTLVAGILAALYGLEEPGPQGLQEKERFRPIKWEGFDVTLSIQIGERDYRIVRDFKTGSAAIWDEKTGQEITSEFTGDNGQVMIGEGLIDLSREGFLKTSLIRQQEVQTLGQSTHISEKVEAMIDTLSGEATVRQAMALLTEARDRYRNGVSVEKEIDQLGQHLEKYQREWERREAELRILDEKVTQLMQIRERWEHLREPLDRVHYGAMLRKKEVLERRVVAYQEKKANLEKLQSELGSLREIASFPSHRARDLTDAINAITAINQRIGTLTADRRETQSRIERADKEKAQRFETIQWLGEEDLSEIYDLLKALRQDRSMLQQVRGEYAAEKERILQEGYLLQDYSDLKKTVGKITAEEKSDLARYHEAAGRNEKEINALERVIRKYKEKAETIEAELTRVGKSRNRALLLGGFLILLTLVIHAFKISPYKAILVEFPIDWWIVQAILGALGVFVASWGVIRSHRGRKEKGEAWSQRMETLKTLLVSKEKTEKQQAQERTAMEKLAVRLEFPSPEVLSEKLRLLERLEERTANLRTIGLQLKEIKSRVAANRKKLAAFMKKGEEEAESLAGEEILQFYQKVEDYRRNRSERKIAQNRLAELKEEIQKANGEKKEKRDLLISILNESHIVWDEDGVRAIQEFKEKLHRFRRFLELRDELIPRAERDQIPEETYQSVVSDLKGVEASVIEMEKKYPEIKRDDGHPVRALSNDSLKEKEGEIERISEERQVLRNEVLHLLEHARRDIDKLEVEMERCRKDREKAMFFEKASRLALQHMETVRREQHHRWAEFLSEKANTILPLLNPNCESIDVKPDLSFSIHHKGLQTTLDPTHVDGLLSVGARDQIYLALRVAISQHLSAAGTHLPFILDDPLITSDDDQFVETMNFIVKTLTKTHQVIILTCHEKRHRWWLDHLSKRYKNRIEVAKLQPQTPAESDLETPPLPPT